MTRNSLLLVIAFLAIVTWTVSCVHEPFPVPKTDTTTGNYPTDVAKIIITKCVDGCHDQANYKANGNLLLDNWEHMFQGGSSGAVLVPYSAEFSSLLSFINTDTNAGPVSKPTMPYNLNPPYDKPPLNKDEYNTIKNWVVNGCPDRNGNIPFATDGATRQKIYMTMQGCNQVAVIDAKSRLVMRYIKVGDVMGDKSPHSLHVSPDGQYAYVCFSSNGSVMQKINTTTDKVESHIDLNQYSYISGYVKGNSWNAFHIRKDGTDIAVTDLKAAKMLIFNTATMKDPYDAVNANLLHNLHGIGRFHGATALEDTFLVTSQYGNAVYKIWRVGYYPISLNSQPITYLEPGNLNPHDILMFPDESKYFVTCQGIQNEDNGYVVVMDTHLDMPLATIKVGSFPQEMAYSKKTNKLFVTCRDEPDVNSTSSIKFQGCVCVIDLNNLNAAPVYIRDQKMSQPHGIAVDDENNMIYVSSINIDVSGPIPHHSSTCGGRNGFYFTYDLNTLQRVGIRNEVLPFPYAAEARFK